MTPHLLITLVLTVGCFAAVSMAQEQPQATPRWKSGFEGDYPGPNWYLYDNGSYTADGVPNAGHAAHWTIADDPRFVFAGRKAYKGWATGKADASHRAYPGVHCDVPSPFVNSFMFYLDIDYARLQAPEWVHLATWGNNPKWAVHTLSVRDRKLEMAHLNWKYIGPQPRPDFPLRQWVRITAYVHYDGPTGYVRIWQDGVPMLEGTYTRVPGRNLRVAHWGWYSSGSIDQGVQYNDEIEIWSLDKPLTDLKTEPPSPYQKDAPATQPGPTTRPGA